MSTSLQPQMEEAPLVVVCSAEAELALFVRHSLNHAGFRTVIATSAQEAERRATEEGATAAFIDGQMPDADTLCRALRGHGTASRLRILVLISGHGAEAYASFLDAGMDEGFVRPVEPGRFIEALTRLTTVAARQAGNPTRLIHGDIEIELASRRVRRAGLNVRLTLTEFELLCRLAREPTCVLTRQELIVAAWPKGIFVDPRTVNIHIGRLRRRLMAGGKPDVIRTVRGRGYALD